jgi:hypothetical protein
VKRSALALLVLALPASVIAQGTTTGPLALKMSSSARTLAMGDMGVAGRDDDVIFYNPAQLVVARGTSFSLSRLSATARGATMSTGVRLGSGAIGFGTNYLEYQRPAVYPVSRNEVLGPGSVVGSSLLGVVGYAQTYKGVRLGAAAKYAVDADATDRYRNIYGDVGAGRDFGRYSTALSIQNLGSALERGVVTIKVPTTATLGVATARALGPFDGAATAGVSYSREDELTVGGGAEMGWSWLSGYNIAVRAGAHQARQDGDTELMAGIGFTADRMTFDIAAERLPGNRAGYRAGIRIR